MLAHVPASQVACHILGEAEHGQPEGEVMTR